MKYLQGDLLKLANKGYFDIIVHGCNCQNVMGAGIAKQIKEQYPLNFEIDKKGILPGTIKSVVYLSKLVVVNAYTQIHHTTNPKNIHPNHVGLHDGEYDRYMFIRICMKKINEIYKGKHIGLPLIGCGLAGGDWGIVEKIIRDELKDCKVTIVKYLK